jgi:heme/copper-type cytochrome/quinol oxidase subunit 1
METILILMVVFGVFFLIYSFVDLVRDRRFTKRQKANLSFLIFMLPFVGSFIYFFLKWNRKNIVDSQM